MTTLSDFVRWARDRVIETPEAAQYELVIDVPRDVQNELVNNEFLISHNDRTITLYVDDDEVEPEYYDDDYDPL